MDARVRALVVGSVNVDLHVRVPRHPEPGETAMGESLLRLPGGKGGNQAVALARLGADVRLHAAVGDDPDGRWSVEELARAGVDVDGVVRVSGSSTGSAIVVVDGEGGNRIVVVPGANGRLGRLDAIPDIDVVVAQLEVPLDVVETTVAAAGRKGVPVVLNAAPAVTLPPGLLTDVDVLVVNVPELETLGAGRDPATLARAVVVTRGADGADVYTADGVTHVAAPAVDVVDTTGAGDCFVAALAHAVARGRSLVAAAEFACRAASLSVTSVGARGGFPTFAQVQG